MKLYLCIVLSALACTKTNNVAPQATNPQAPSQPTAVKFPEPEMVEPEGDVPDPAPKLFRTGGTFYWLVKDQEKGFTCERWTVKPDKKNSSEEVANGEMSFQWKDENGAKAKTIFGYSYFFVDKEGIYQSETMPGYEEATAKGMSFEEAQSKYTRHHRNTWWMDLLGPRVESESFESSLGCAEGHPLTSFSSEAIKYGTELWFLNQKACDAAIKASQAVALNAGC